MKDLRGINEKSGLHGFWPCERGWKETKQASSEEILKMYVMLNNIV